MADALQTYSQMAHKLSGILGYQVGYFGVDLNLRTESPKPAAIRRAASRSLSEPEWKQNALS